MKTTINFDNSVVKAEIMNVREIPLHKHECIQIILVLEGEIDLFVAYKNYNLKRGDSRYIHHEDVHGMKSISDNQVLVISISSEFAEKLYPGFIYETISINISDENIHEQETKAMLNASIAKVAADYFEKNSTLLTELTELIDMLHINFRSVYINASNTFVHKSFNNNSQEEIINKIISYIYHYYNKKIYLKNIAEEYNISRDHLSHLFSKYTGLSFQDFVTMARVEKSVSYILESSDSIEKISMECGFSHSRFFLKGFKKYCDIDVREFREKYSNWTNTSWDNDYFILEYDEICHKINNMIIFANKANDYINNKIKMDELSFENMKIMPSLILQSSDLFCEEFTILFNSIENASNIFKKYIFSLPQIKISDEKDFTIEELNYFPVEEIFDNIYNIDEVSLFSTVENYGLFYNNGIKTILYYFFVWLLSLPEKKCSIEHGIICEDACYQRIIVSNPEKIASEIFRINALREKKAIVYHYILNEEPFTATELINEQYVSTEDINKSTEPILKLFFKSEEEDTLQLNLPSRSINYIVVKYMEI